MLESEFWVSFLYVLELEPGWNTYDIPFIAVSRSVAEEKPSSGFWHSDEIGVLGNDKLDLDKIAGITLELHMSAPQDDSTIAEGTVLLDDLVLESNTTGVNDNVINPRSFSLEQNYPNPFNPSTHIQFDIASQVNVRLNVYDILGREVATLVDKEMMPGKHNLVFDAGDLPSGIYFYKIQAGKYSQTNKMILLK
ncbi:MAG: T9SS type A sorting domain-containing protein [Ignavibacteriaceae bacterium]